MSKEPRAIDTENNKLEDYDPIDLDINQDLFDVDHHLQGVDLENDLTTENTWAY